MLDNMRLCPNGHYYDSSRFQECPYCKPGTPAENGAGISQSPFAGPAAGTPSVTVPLNQNVSAPAKQSADMEKTQVLVEQKTGYNPVVGWLVCIEGPDKGKDFRLHAGNNFVGRGATMDVILQDKAVSAKNAHFSISYDKKHDRYFMAGGQGQEIVYINDEPLTASATDIKRGDRIEVANTTLVFIPLSKEDVQWQWE